MKFRIDTPKFLISSAVAVICLSLSVSFFAVKSMAAGVVFLVVGCVYTLPAYQMGGTISVDRRGVTAAHLFGRRRFAAWTELSEVGILGTKVFNRDNPQRTGAKYIYFSRAALTKDERFRLALKWPPSDILYMRYDDRRLKAVRQYWKEPITVYNTGNLVVEPPVQE